MSEGAGNTSWNYRVIEFVNPGDERPWRAIHEVHYEDGKPVSYSENHAVVLWDTEEGDKAAEEIIERMRAALSKSVLVEKDFRR